MRNLGVVGLYRCCPSPGFVIAALCLHGSMRVLALPDNLAACSCLLSQIRMAYKQVRGKKPTLQYWSACSSTAVSTSLARDDASFERRDPISSELSGSQEGRTKENPEVQTTQRHGSHGTEFKYILSLPFLSCKYQLRLVVCKSRGL